MKKKSLAFLLCCITIGSLFLNDFYIDPKTVFKDTSYEKSSFKENFIKDNTISFNKENPQNKENSKEDMSKENNSTKENSKEEDKISQFDLSSLDKKEYSWYFAPNTPGIAETYKEKYDLYYEGDTSKKEIYLTFDCGYENGITPKILDILKEHNITAAFFITSDYLKTSSDLVDRMIKEGHVVGNHTDKHPSMASKALQSRESTYLEIQKLEKKYEEAMGKPMEKFFRPPMGKFSEASLALTKELGYKSIFWNNAYKDYDVKAQPEPTASKNLIRKRMKDGGIILLHAVSKTNAEILPDLIETWKAEGYEIKSLRELPNYN